MRGLSEARQMKKVIDHDIKPPFEKCTNRLATYDATRMVGDAKGNQWSQVASEFHLMSCGDPRLAGASDDRGNNDFAQNSEHPSFADAELVVPTVHGFNLAIYADFTSRDRLISSCLAFSGEWEQQTSFLIKTLLQQYANENMAGPGEEDTLFIDAGANMGYFSLLAASNGFDVLSAEMSVQNALHLARSAALHNEEHIADKITLYLLALSAADGVDVDEEDVEEWPLTAVMNDFSDNSGLYEVFSVLDEANAKLRQAFSPRTEGYGQAWTVKKALDEVLRDYVRRKARTKEFPGGSSNHGAGSPKSRSSGAQDEEPKDVEEADQDEREKELSSSTFSTIQWRRLLRNADGELLYPDEDDEDDEVDESEPQPEDPEDGRQQQAESENGSGTRSKDPPDGFCNSFPARQFEFVDYFWRKWNRRFRCGWKQRTLKIVLKLDLEKSICEALSGFRDFLHAAVDSKSGLFRVSPPSRFGTNPDEELFVKVELLAIFAEGDHMDVPGRFFEPSRFFHNRTSPLAAVPDESSTSEPAPTEQSGKNCFYALRDLLGTGKNGRGGRFYGGSYESDNVSGELAWINQRSGRHVGVLEHAFGFDMREERKRGNGTHWVRVPYADVDTQLHRIKAEFRTAIMEDYHYDQDAGAVTFAFTPSAARRSRKGNYRVPLLLTCAVYFHPHDRGASACTNLIVTPGASVNGSTIYSYAADSAGLYGSLTTYPRRKNIPPGSTKDIYDWDSGLFLGRIEEPAETYNVVGNMNEFQLTIGETTFGGVGVLTKGQKHAKMDYGNLIWTTLQRAKNVQEAIGVMTDLVAKYGYASEGESFTLADPTEVWILEMIGKGEFGFGAVWAAVRVPDGHVSGHANQARITTFDVNDTANVRAAPDVEEFAKKVGLYDPSKGEAFNWAEAYDPISFVGARWSDARVWSFFSKVTSIPNFQTQYENYVLGHAKDLKSHRMPLSVPVKEKLRVSDLMLAMRNSFEDSALQMQSDVGMGPWRARYRDRPLSWSYQGKQYANERSIGTQQTAWHFVSEMRSWLPNDLGGVFWFGVDDARFSVHVPFYAHAEVPRALQNPTSTSGMIDAVAAPAGDDPVAPSSSSASSSCNGKNKPSTGARSTTARSLLAWFKGVISWSTSPASGADEDCEDALTISDESDAEDLRAKRAIFTSLDHLPMIHHRTSDDLHDDIKSKTKEQAANNGRKNKAAPNVFDITTFSFESLFWLNNLVANRVYNQWDVLAPLVSRRVHILEAAFFTLQAIVEKQAMKMAKGPARSAFLSAESAGMTELAAMQWRELWLELTVTWRDGVKVLPARPGHDHGGSSMGGPVADVVQGSGVGNGEWPDEWKARIVAEAGDHFVIPAQEKTSTTIRQQAAARKEPVAIGKERNAATVQAVLKIKEKEGAADGDEVYI
eukprot:g4313.t1